MPTETPLWFNQDQYLANKAEQLNITAFGGTSEWTSADVMSAIEGAGLTPYEHFVQYGNAENISPNDYFNVDAYFTAKANALNAAAGEGDKNDWTAWDVVTSFQAAHLSAWDHYTLYGQVEDLNPSNQFDTSSYLQAKAAALNSDPASGSTSWTAAQVAESFAAAGLNPIEHYYLYGQQEGLAFAAVPADDQVTPPDGFSPWTPAPDQPEPPAVNPDPIFLTTGLDVINASSSDPTTADNDYILAPEFDGVNTLQSGDRIDGGAGTDYLFADVSAGSSLGHLLNTVRPTVNNVEVIKFTSQQSTDSPSGGMDSAEIRADRISGAQQIWSSDSRVDLTVADVRVDSNTALIGFQNADGNWTNGNPGYTVLFNDQNLKAADATVSGVLNIQVMDINSAVANPDQPLLNNPWVAITFAYNGNLVTLNFGEVSGPEATYDTLLAAIQKAIQDTPAAAGLSAEIVGTFDASQSVTDIHVTGQNIQIKAENGTLSISEPGCGWATATGIEPPAGNFVHDMLPDNPTDCPLIQTTIGLDNAGMVNWDAVGQDTCIPDNHLYGDYAGAVTVGGMGDGNYVGVQRFDVTVDRSSWISELKSTNNALRMVKVTNGNLDQTTMDQILANGVPTTSTQDALADGNLFIGEGQRLSNDSLQIPNTTVIANGAYVFEGRDGLLQNVAEYAGQGVSRYSATNTAGLTDVMYFDAADMTGRANISAAITDASSPKYFGDTDEVAGTGSQYAPNGGKFGYNFGAANDTLNMTIDGNVAADNDFVMNIDMGDGNNSVRTQFMQKGVNLNWIENQHDLLNLNITTGTGNDIVNPFGTGSANVSTGAGNDIVYSDNSGIMNSGIIGAGAVYVLNAQGNTPAACQIAVANGEIVPLQNGISSHVNPTFGGTVDGATSGNMTLEVLVTYKGVTGTATKSLSISSTGGVSITAAEVNQMIINAVNDGSWLSALMSAKEGAGNSLLMISKVDGHVQIDDLQIKFISTYNNETVTPGFEAYDEAAGKDISLDTWYGDDWATEAGGHKEFANMDGTTTSNVEGNDSTAEADNIINLGAGTDLAVLSTGSSSNDTIVLNASNNGDNTIVNFDMQALAKGNDTINASAILGEDDPDQIVANSVDGLNMANVGTVNGGAGIYSGSSATDINTAVVFVQNYSKDSTDYVDTAAELQTKIGANTGITNATCLYMVYDAPADYAAPTTQPVKFTMYKVVFGSTAGTPTVTSLSSLTFADFIVGMETGPATGYKFSNALSDFLTGVGTDNDNIFMDNRLNNGPSAMESSAWAKVQAGMTDDVYGTSGYTGPVAAFSGDDAIDASHLKGGGDTIKLTTAIKNTDDLDNYSTGSEALGPVTTIDLGSGTNTVTLDGTNNNSKYDWEGTTGTDTFAISGAYTGDITGGSNSTTYNVTGAATGELKGGSAGTTTYNFTSGVFAGKALAGAGDAIFNIADASYAATETKGGAGVDTINITANLTGTLTIEGGEGGDKFNIGNGTASAACANVTLNGGAAADTFTIKASSAFSGTANGEAGDDFFVFEAANAKGTYNGGDGSDTVQIAYAASTAVVFDPSATGGSTDAKFVSIENVSFKGGSGKLNLTDWTDPMTVDATEAAAAVEITTSKQGDDTIKLNNSKADTVILTQATSIANQGEVTITGFESGDVLNVKNFVTGGAATAVVSGSTPTITWADKGVYIVNGQNYTETTSASAISTLAGTVTANEESVFVMQGADDINYVYYVKASGTSVAAGDIHLLGTVTADADLAAANVVSA